MKLWDPCKFLPLVKPPKFTVIFFNNSSFHLEVRLIRISKILNNHATQQDQSFFTPMFGNLSIKRSLL